MTVLDLSQANRLFYGADELSAVWYGGQQLWAGADAKVLKMFDGARKGLVINPSDPATRFQDAAGSMHVTTHLQRLGLVRDKSPNGFHVSQPIADDRPTYEVVGGKSFMTGNGLRHHLKTVDLNFSHTTTMTIGMAVTRAGPTGVVLAEFGRNHADTGEWYLSTEDSYRVNMGGPSYRQRGTLLALRSVDIVIGTFDRGSGGSSPNIWQNGVLSAQAIYGGGVTGPFNNLRPIILLARWTGSQPSAATSSKVAGFFVLDRLVTEPERLDLQSWLANLGGVTLP